MRRGAEMLKPGDTGLCEAYNEDVSRVVRLAGKMPPARAVLASMELLDAISDPVRAQVLYALSEIELCVCELGELLDMSLPAVSHHIRVLRESGFIQGRKKGRFVFYSLTKSETQRYAVQLLLRLIRAESTPQERTAATAAEVPV
ncbi:MAG: metalloregulator ArsR/SmtB family transcription factor [Chloroflexi bacterium]|nr:metalloregulator ArsR/SmtB family transcription factor [Chloroflexota bacterium]